LKTRKHHNLSTEKTASQFGVDELVLHEIEQTARECLRQRALRRAVDDAWHERRAKLFEGRFRESGINRASQLLAAEDLVREFAQALHPILIDVATTYVEMLTKAILDRRKRRKSIHWQAIIDRAMRFCNTETGWQQSGEWIRKLFDTTYGDLKFWTPRAKVAFEVALSAWSIVTQEWDSETPLRSFQDVAEGRIAHLVRMAPPMESSRSTELPTLQEFLKIGILTQKQAAEFLRCTTRTVRSYIKKGELTKTKGGKVRCDDKWSRKLRNLYGSAVRVT
jgi:hypothetical protein